jgi:hypothetical protein
VPRRWSRASFARAPGRQLGHGDHVVLINSSRAAEDSAERSALGRSLTVRRKGTLRK